jgi:hypothetical protein
MLFVQDSRDAFGTPDELTPIIRNLTFAAPQPNWMLFVRMLDFPQFDATGLEAKPEGFDDYL